MDIVEKRISNLEDILAQTLRTVEQTSREMREFKEEMRAGREASQWEMQEFKETTQQEIQEFKQEMRASREASEREMQKFKQEMQAGREASQREMQEFKQEMQAGREASQQEMQEFKQEMQAGREASQQEMQKFKQDMQEFKQEMQAGRETSQREMQEFKEEMRTFREASDRQIKEMDRRMNRQWGEFSRAMGKMAENLVAPSIPRVLRTVINCQHIDFSAVNVKRHYQNKDAEFDVVAGSGDYILINETKNKLRSEDIKHFAEKVLPKAKNFFPEYADKKFIGAIASLYVDKRQVKDGEKRGIIVLGFGQDVMEVLNSKGFSPKTF